MITVLTATYNREKTLKRTYESLLSQTNKDFEWIVVDDGSTDNTKSLIESFIAENQLDIKYIYKSNGGKHTALNIGTQSANGELLLVLDSDDYLMDNAIETSYEYWEKYKGDESICGMTFLCRIENPIYKSKLFDECVSNMIDFKYNRGILTDMCEVMRTDVLKQYPFPVFKNERFLSEIVAFGEMAKKYQVAYIPKEIYVAEYLDSGLSRNWFKLVINNPLGARANNLFFMSKEFKFAVRLKNCIMFDVFSVVAHEKAISETKMKFWAIVFYVPSFILAKILVKLYKEG